MNSGNHHWIAGVNDRFQGMSIPQIQRLLGAKKAPESARLPLKKIAVDVNALPTNFDSRTAWPNCPTIQEVRDQSDCGSCWAISAAETASDRICVGTNATIVHHISTTDILSCCQFCGNGCDGGYPPSAWQYLASTGAVTGGNYGDNSWCYSYPMPPCAHHVKVSPYPACGANEYPTPQCQNSCDSNSTWPVSWSKDKHVFASAYQIPSDQYQIMTEIMTNGPVQADFTVYSDFLTYTSGVYYYTSGDMLGGHAVKIIGWGVENNIPYWTVANSWNNSWGDNGFFKIRRGTDECGIEDDINCGIYKA